jgi:RNA polymerase sigma-70 factor (ECF subfamily)
MNAPLNRQIDLDKDCTPGMREAIWLHPNSEMAPIEDAQFEAELLELEPYLFSFARSLSRDRELAEDLTQDTLLSAWRARRSFKPGTNLKAWLCIILRNRFYSHARRAWRQMPWDQDAAELLSNEGPEQTSMVELADTVRALECIPAAQREALTLIGAGGFSYGEAAKICSCNPGTLKSRVMRARRALTSLLEGEKAIPGSRRAGEDASDEIVAELARLAFGVGKVGLRLRPQP